MKIVEVVDGVLTEPWVTEALTALATRFGHTPVRCKDTPGFIVNHAGRAFVPESLRVLSEGIADFATIDRILVDAAGFRIGPFGLMDLVGLDVSHAVMQSMYRQYYDEPKYKPSFVADPRVAAGLLGRKTGRGWYTYGKDGAAQAVAEQPVPTKRPAAVWVVPELRELFAKFGVEIRTRADDETVCFVARWARRHHHRAAARPRPGAHGGDRSAVRLRQAAHPDDLARHPARGARHGARPARLRRRAGVGDPATRPASSRSAWSRTSSTSAATSCRCASPRPHDLDRAVTLGLGYPRGPLAMGDCDRRDARARHPRIDARFLPGAALPAEPLAQAPRAARRILA